MTDIANDATVDSMRARMRASTLLVVDDEEANLDLLEAVLEEAGFTSLVRVADARAVMATAAIHPPDLVLLDLHMPHRSGLELLRDLRAASAPDEYLPILVLTADVTAEARERALREGARDFLTKPFDTVEVILRVENLLETRFLYADQRAARQRAEEGEQRAALLAEWSRCLAQSLDTTTALSQLPALVVPSWCDACVVFGDDAHHPIVGELFSPAASSIRPLVLSLPRADDGATTPSELRLADGSCALVAPVALGAAAGAARVATFLFARTGRPFTPNEGALVAEVARRAGLATERARLFAAAELATRERERLLAVVAHDLRNPLGVVAMYAEMMASLQPEGAGAAGAPSASEEYARAALETIHRTTMGMQSLVEDLLDATTLREGAFKLNVADHNAHALFADVERTLRPLVATRGLSLAVQHDAVPPALRVRADAGRVSQVLSNLVGNAIKFSPAGGTIVVFWRADDDGLAVEVRDDGEGIAPHELPHLFTAFWQGRAHNMRGAGLGLWIARAIVEGHGGAIGVISAPGAGATFHFTIPTDGKQCRWED